MNVNQLATWLENNQHKFIFYCYPGGTGGEFVCDYIIEHSDLYNTTALTFNNAYNKIEEKDKFNTSVTNRYNFLDPMLYGSLANSFQTGEEMVQDIIPDTSNIKTFTELATMIIEYVRQDYRDIGALDESMLHDFSKQDKKYLIRIHKVFPYMKLFNKSKIHLVKADKWNMYTSLLAECKCLLTPYYTKEEKLNALTIEHRLYNNLKLEKSISYISNILEDDTVPLYQYTIQVMINPSIFDIDITTLTINELQKMLWQLVVYRHLQNKYRDDNHSKLAYTKTYHSEWINEYNINLISFEDVFLGNWANTEFKLDKEDFYNAMVRWDQRNTIYLNKIGVKPKRGIKRLNQGLYNDSE